MADIQSLNALLRVVHLLDALYARALAEPELLYEETPERAAVQAIRPHLAAHATRLQALGATRAAPTQAQIDWTGAGGKRNGPFDPFVYVDDFLRLAQPLEDLAVRAALGAWEAQGDDTPAAAAVAGMLGAHARHAARIRQLRDLVSFIDVKPWVTDAYAGYDFDDPSLGDVVKPVYAGEDNRVQPPFTFPQGDTASTEAFDEPLAADVVDAFTSRFVTG